MNDKIEICILAAGMGTRMKSTLPKVLHPIAGKPMLEHLLDTANDLMPHCIHVVVGSGAEIVKAQFPDLNINWVVQSSQKGTGHAVMQAMPHFKPESRVLILVGDAPLLSLETMRALMVTRSDLSVLTVEHQNPFNYGRIIREGDRLLEIIEERDATPEQKKIKEVNTGVMLADANKLGHWLEKIDTENSQGEYLLTDIIGIANDAGSVVMGIKSNDADETLGVNNFQQLAYLERIFQKRCADQLMIDGVHLIDPNRFNLRGSLIHGQDVAIDINCVFEGAVTLGNNVTISANCHIKDTIIGDNSVIKPNTVIEGAVIANDCSVGPFARIRPGTELDSQVGIGNFVEIKKSHLGRGTKAGHLSYLGDAVIGSQVNIGAGTITCNYDGKYKHVTRIADNVFVGSNAALVAPVMIGEKSFIAAGSTITQDVANESLAIARGKQRNISNWKGLKDK